MSLFVTFPPRKTPFLLLALVLAAHPLNAVGISPTSAQIELSNGDKISGTIIRSDDQQVIIKSPMLGEIAIPRSALAKPTPPKPVQKTTATKPAAKTAKPVPTAAQGIKPASKPWRTKVEFGFLLESGRNEITRQNILIQAEKTFGQNTVRANGRLNYVKQNDKDTKNRTEAGLRWRRNFGKGTFTQTQSSYYRDPIASIDINLEQNVGLGYRLIESDLHTLNVGAGLTAQYREAENVTTNTGALTEFFQDQTIKLNDVAKLIQTLTLQYWPSAPYAAANTTRDTDNLKWKFSTTLEGKLSKHLSLNLRYEYDYDSAVADPSSRETQRVTSSLGYLF